MLLAGEAIVDDAPPNDIAIAFDDAVRVAAFEGLFRKQGRVDAAIDDGGAALFRELADFIAAQRIAGMDADADDVAGLYLGGVDLLDRFIHQDRIAYMARGLRLPERRAIAA